MTPNGIVINGQFFDFNNGIRALPAQWRAAIAAHLMNPPPVRHAEPTVLLSLDDEPWRPSRRLLDLAAQLAAQAPAESHPILSYRHGSAERWFEVFPGEHYHLLSALTRLLKPKIVWEFGTDTGMGTVALMEGLASDGKIYTVDIDPWLSKNGPWLVPDDIHSGRVTQVIADMKAPALFAQYGDQLSNADLVFVDGPKDGVTEAAFLEQFAAVPLRNSTIVLFDDIRVANMLGIWRGIHRPKMDLTSFGHWSGTGLVDWC